MISSAFYHTGEVAVNGMVLTNDLKSCADITDITSDFAYPYYMGYLQYNEMPTNMNFGFYDLVDSTHLEFSKQTPRNHAWGYGTCMNNGGQPEGGLVYIDSNNQMQYHPSQYYDGTYYPTKYRFINQAKLSGLAYANRVDIYGVGMIVPSADLDENLTAYNYASNTDSQYKTVGGQITCGVVPGSSYTANIKDFLEGNCDLDFGTATVDGETIALKISMTDFGYESEAPVVRKYFEVNGTEYVLFFTIQSYQYKQYAKYTDGNNTYAVAVVPFIEYDDPKGYGAKWYCFGDNTNNSDTLKVTLEYYYGCSITSVQPYGREYYTTGFLGDFFIDGNVMYGTSDNNHPEECWWYGSNTNYHMPAWGRNGIIRGRHIVTMESNMSGGFFMRKMVHPEDIYKHYMLFHKVDTLHTSTDVVPTQTYTTDYSVSLFNSSDKPNNERVEENYSATLLEKLRPWQYPDVDLAINAFEIDDMPEYNPEGDDDATLDQFSGDNVFFNLSAFGATKGFITHWVMTGGQVNNFGQYVWQNLLDFDSGTGDPLPGVWENLKIAANTYFTTGSVDPASLMQLIIGLRFYPFDLENQSTAATDECIYFGTGKYGVPVRGPGEKTRTLNWMSFRLGPMSIVLPSSSDWWYKDFRDYEGSTAFIYLPFCGTYQIPISEITPNTQFDINYEVDLATGSCTAYVGVVHANGTSTGPKTYPLVIANGQCGFEVPLSSTNANRLNATIIADAQKVVGAIAGPITDSANKVISGVTAAVTGGADINVGGVEDLDFGGAAAISAGGPMGGVAALGGQTALKAGGNLVNVASGMATRSGCAIPLLQGGRGWSALANPLTPYIQIRRGRYLYAKGYGHAVGKPENRDKTISNIKGFFQCNNVDMSGVSATSAEINMIKRMLETGVYRK